MGGGIYQAFRSHAPGGAAHGFLQSDRTGQASAGQTGLIPGLPAYISTKPFTDCGASSVRDFGRRGLKKAHSSSIMPYQTFSL